MVIIGNIDKVQVLGIALSLIILVSVFFLVRERMLKEKYSLVWFFIGLFLLFISSSREMLEGFSLLIGIEYAPSALFALLIGGSYLLLLNMSVSISGLKTHNKELTQELGLTKLRLEELERKVNKAGL